LEGRRLRDADTWLNDLQAEAPELRGLPTLVAELEFRDRSRGLLMAAGELGQERFDASDEQVFESFAAGAATTIATVRTVEAEKLQMSIEASERERHRWARELHDETLQELGALRVLLDAAGGDELSAESRQIAVEHVDRGIRNLQGLITELRPSVLDELGVGPAIDSLARRSSERFGVVIDADVDVASEQPDGPHRLPPDLEATIYRLVQEASNNAIKHAEPNRISVTVSRGDDLIEVIVADDGSGFDPDTAERSFGLVGMQERVSLLGGTLEIDSAPGKGTEVRAGLPVTEPGQGAGRAGSASPPRSAPAHGRS
ncbi:MAG: sensor histidine kinase, partial [Solirubrobacterales bacterium]